MIYVNRLIGFNFKKERTDSIPKGRLTTSRPFRRSSSKDQERPDQNDSYYKWRTWLGSEQFMNCATRNDRHPYTSALRVVHRCAGRHLSDCTAMGAISQNISNRRTEPSPWDHQLKELTEIRFYDDVVAYLLLTSLSAIP